MSNLLQLLKAAGVGKFFRDNDKKIQGIALFAT